LVMATASCSSANQKIRIWQFLDVHFGSWRYFSADQCQSLRQGVDRGQQTVQLQGCIVNFLCNEMQIQQVDQPNLPTIIPIRQIDIAADSIIAEGIAWEWEIEHNEWIPYRDDANELIEREFSRSKNQWKKDVDLSVIGLPYTINYKKNFQRNTYSGFKRKIRRNIYGSYKDTLPIITDNDMQDDSLHKKEFSTGNNDDLKGTNSSAIEKKGENSEKTAVDLTQSPRSNVSAWDRKLHKQKYKQLADFILPVDNQQLPDENCIICFEEVTAASGFSNEDESSSRVVMLSQCKHYFHDECIFACVQSKTSEFLECPKCRTLHGIKTGNQPEGTMTYVVQNGMQIPGFNSTSAIVITYNFRSGIQGPQHPNPGARYHANAFPRVAYLPNTAEGQEVLRLLQIAWARSLIFAIGRSSTSGADNVIVWNDIHHKTEWQSNYSGHGYPDPDYIKRVTEELHAHGIR
ncbi:putative E3 ubiquitin-protein ligase DTX2, partial [Trichoplax sp. H2]